MNSFISFLEELSYSTNIKFKVNSDDDSLNYDGLLDDEIESIYFNINLGNTKTIICLPKQYEICKSLLKYTIEDKYKEVFSEKGQYIIDILDGKEVSIGNIEGNYSFLNNKFTLMLIAIDGSTNEAFSIIKDLYNEENVLSIIYGNSIVILCNFDDVYDNAEAIRTSINSELYCKCYISYIEDLNDIYKIKKSYDNAKEAIYLGKKYQVREEIYVYNKMLFEKLVYHINKDVKEEILESLKDKFNLFDSEIINTIEEFVNCDLNISNTAKKLYVHRNTLLYRLDKIKKETGFDIRNFKEATVFIIAFLVWKEYKDKQ